MRFGHRLVQAPRRDLRSLGQRRQVHIAELGAKIVEEGSDLSIAAQRASAYSQAHDLYFLNDATDPDVPAGAATVALEIFEQLPSADSIVVPIGDTALIRGVAAAAKSLSPAVRVIGVQAEQAPAYYLSWKQGKVVSTETASTIADGLATRTPEADNVRAIRELVDDIVLVSEDEMLAAVRHLVMEEHVIAEPAGAAATAALIHNRFQCGRHTVLLVTGANISPDVLRAAICG
jgi:threonine dehydratase